MNRRFQLVTDRGAVSSLAWMGWSWRMDAVEFERRIWAAQPIREGKYPSTIALDCNSGRDTIKADFQTFSESRTCLAREFGRKLWLIATPRAGRTSAQMGRNACQHSKPCQKGNWIFRKPFHDPFHHLTSWLHQVYPRIHWPIVTSGAEMNFFYTNVCDEYSIAQNSFFGRICSQNAKNNPWTVNARALRTRTFWCTEAEKWGRTWSGEL